MTRLRTSYEYGVKNTGIIGMVPYVPYQRRNSAIILPAGTNLLLQIHSADTRKMPTTTSSKEYPYYVSSKAETRDGNYVFVPIPANVITSMFSSAEKLVQTANVKIQEDGRKINDLVKRETTHEKQPFHDLPPHISIAYNTTKPNALELIETENGSLDLNLAFKVTNIKLIPPTRNGSLSLVYTIEFATETQDTMNKIAESLGEPLQYGWHITVGQSFYEPNTSEVIFNLNSQEKINITMIDESKSKELNVFESWALIKQHKEYFKETLMPYLKSRGYTVGLYRGNEDHIVLPLEDAHGEK